jgi:hypothetical protein
VAAWLSMMKYIFALDPTHYCRWSSIENFDLLRMETILPTIFDEFMCGHFVA